MHVVEQYQCLRPKEIADVPPEPGRWFALYCIMPHIGNDACTPLETNVVIAVTLKTVERGVQELAKLLQ